MKRLEDVTFNLENLLSCCKIAQGVKSEVSIKLIEGLETKYSIDKLVCAYNYFLQKEINSDVMIHLIKLLDKFRYKSSLEVLLKLLNFEEPFCSNLKEKENYVNVRSYCAKAISNHKDQSSVLYLLNCLNNKNENYKLRLSAAEALGKIGDRYAVSPLIDVLSDEDEKSVYLRESAAVALGMIGDVRALEPFLGILEAKRGIIDKFTYLKERIIESLTKINIKRDEKVFLALKHSLMDESPQIRINAIEALMNSEDQRAYDLIWTMIYDKDEEVQKNSVIALYNIDGKDSLKEILKLDNASNTVKSEARSILENESEEDE